MKKYITILILMITLISCDRTLHKANPKEDTLFNVEEISKDTVLYKILIINESTSKFNVYTKDNELLYKDCISTSSNDIMTIPVGSFVITVTLFMLIGIVITIMITE